MNIKVDEKKLLKHIYIKGCINLAGVDWGPIAIDRLRHTIIYCIFQPFQEIHLKKRE